MWDLYAPPEPDDTKLAQFVSYGIIMVVTMAVVVLCSLL